MAQGQRSRSNFWRAVVDIRGSALPSAAKSKEEPLPVQKVCLCACNQWVYADNCADAVDRLLILYGPSTQELHLCPDETWKIRPLQNKRKQKKKNVVLRLDCFLGVISCYFPVLDGSSSVLSMHQSASAPQLTVQKPYVVMPSAFSLKTVPVTVPVKQKSSKRQPEPSAVEDRTDPRPLRV